MFAVISNQALFASSLSLGMCVFSLFLRRAAPKTDLLIQKIAQRSFSLRDISVDSVLSLPFNYLSNVLLGQVLNGRLQLTGTWERRYLGKHSGTYTP